MQSNSDIHQDGKKNSLAMEIHQEIYTNLHMVDFHHMPMFTGGKVKVFQDVFTMRIGYLRVSWYCCIIIFRSIGII